MKTLAELQKEGEAILADLEKLEGELAKAGDDAEKGKSINEQIDVKSKSFDVLEAEIKRIREQISRKAMLDGLKVDDGKKGDLAPDEGKTKPDPAQVADHVKEAADLEGFFLDYICGKSIPVEAKDKLSATSVAMQAVEAAKDGIVFPERISAALFGKSVAYMLGYEILGKAIPMVTTSPTVVQSLPSEDFQKKLLELPAEAPHILDRATVVPAPLGTVTWPRLVQTDTNEYGGVAICWISEGGEKAETEAEFDQVKISTNEVSAYTELSHTLLDRSFLNLDALVARLFRGAINDALDNAFLTGSGTGQPLGIINTTGIRTVTRATAGVVSHADLVNLKYAVRPYHRAAGTFVLEDSVTQSLELTYDTLGRTLFAPSVAGTVPDRLVGKPWLDTTRLPALGTTGDVLFGDLREYIVAMEKEVVVRRSDHYRFRNNLAAFTVVCLVGGELVQPRVMSILQDGS